MERNQFNDELPAIIERAKSLKVVDEASARFVSGLVNEWRARKKAFLGWINPHISRLNEAHKALTRDRAMVENGYDGAINYGGSLVITWQDQEEQKRKEAEARLQAELKAREEEARLAEAIQLEKAGDHEMAEAVISQPIEPPRIILPPVEKLIGTRTTWHAVVYDKMLLIKAVANGEVPMIALEPNMVHLNQQAVSMKNEMNYPGVKATPREGQSGK